MRQEFRILQDSNRNRPRRVLAVASGGGHWMQLRRLFPAVEGHDVAYVTTMNSYRPDVGEARFYVVNDASRWNRLGLLKTAFQVFWIVMKERPDVIFSTGAAPGYFALRVGKMFGARTIWLDSIANADELSMAGREAGKHADLWLTQWPHLARPDGPRFAGAVI